jgi:hypothetical protein
MLNKHKSFFSKFLTKKNHLFLSPLLLFYRHEKERKERRIFGENFFFVEAFKGLGYFILATSGGSDDYSFDFFSLLKMHVVIDGRITLFF